MSIIRGLRLGLDLDGVVADYTAALRVSAAKLGIGQGLQGNPTTWGMVEPGWFDSKEQWLAAHTDVFRTGAHAIPLLDAGAADALVRFRAAGGVVIVTTARSGIVNSDVTDEKVRSDTEKWLEMHEYEVDDLVLTSDKAQADCHLYIDDSPGVIQSLQAAGKPVVVRDQLYNRHVSAEHRVFSVPEMLELISGVIPGSGLLSLFDTGQEVAR